jgi:DNA-binding response OmpR family regulator
MTDSTILMVDDSATVLTFERMMLREEGYQLKTASNGRLALDAIKQGPPDLILLDIVMPEMDGVECCKRLKADAATKHIPVIMVTTKGNQTMVTAAYAAGCDDFITKPIDKVELLHKIRGHLERRSIGGAKK